MNTILLFLSQDRDYSKAENNGQQDYWYGDSVYTGIQTNDAPVRMLMDQNERIDSIIAITTKEVQNDKVINGMTTLERFKEMVDNEASIHGYDAPAIITIPYANTEIEDAHESALRIYQKITEYLDSDEEQNVMIDFTGGMRDVSFLMTTIIRYLQVAGIRCEKIIYSSLKPPKIVDLDYIYDMFQQVNAVNEFVTTGSATELKKIYAGTDEIINNMIEAIQNFSDTVLMCNSGRIDDAISQLTKVINVEIESETFESGLFKTLIPIIKKKMYLESGNMEYPDLIRWCLDNRMIQQAVTFYIEKMPVYYFDETQTNPIDRKYIEEAENKPSSLASSPETQAFYINLFDHYTEDKSITRFMQAVKEIASSEETDDHAILNHIRDMRNEYRHNHDDVMEAAFSRLEDIVRRRYIDMQNGVKIYGNPFKQNSVKAFINSIETNGGWQHYFVHNDQADYENKKNGGTYMKKAMAIEALRNDGGDSLLLQRMECYLAVKLLRNHMNHATGSQNNGSSTISDGERYAVDMLVADGFPDIENPSVKDVMDVIQRGLDLEKNTDVQ